MKTEKKKSKVGIYILSGALTVFLLALILSFNDINAIFEVLKTADVKYILLSVLAIFIYLALYPLSLCILTRARGTDIKFGRTYNIAMTEHFFNGITPFATGGQPFQAYAYAKSKVKVSESTGLLLMNFIVFMLVTNSFALCSLFYFKRFVADTAMTVIAIVGFTMNFIVLACTVILAANRRVAAAISRFVDFLCRFRWIGRFLAPRSEALKLYFVQVQDAFSELWKKKKAFFLALFTKALSMAAYYSTTFFILRALHINAQMNDFLFILLGSSFAITTVVFLPTPGSSGGIEFAFSSVFASIIIASTGVASTATVAAGGMLIWRMLTYYFTMLISLGFYILLEIRFSRRARLAGEGGEAGTDSSAEIFSEESEERE